VRRAGGALAAAPLAVQVVFGVIVALVLWAAANWTYHVIRKPSELFFPVSGVLYKTPTETWDEYGSRFRAHSTAVITPEFLAALAQIEATGNPLARTYWRWQLVANPLAIYRPASSAVGLYQITDATFAEAQRYCVRDHVVVEAGPWHDLRSCWFNGLYTRVVPSHAIELTSAYLDRRVAATLARNRIAAATLRQKQDLAAVIHLCGAGAGNAYAKGGLKLTSGQRCGDHDVRDYLARINAMQHVFARLAAAT
jgi:hypothetical protein